jgi:FkbM family methyltransferase
LGIVAYLDLHREHGGPKYHGVDVVFGDEQARLDPTLPILFGTRPKKADFYATPPAPQRCLWLDPPTGWKLHPKVHHHLLSRHSAELERVFRMLADDESRMTFASIVRTRLAGDSGYFRVAGYPEYRHPMALARPGDTVIDGGAFDGDSSRLFADLVGKEGRVFAMEPSRANFTELCRQSTSAGLRQIVPVAMGLWSEPALLRFTDDEGGSSNLSPSGGSEVAVTSIDFLVEQHRLDRVDVIKLDVEGAEAQALHGARQTLERMRPALHVSIYHRPNDLFELPLMLDDWLDGYRFWIGHHNFYHTETDLYAVPEERIERADD